MICIILLLKMTVMLVDEVHEAMSFKQRKWLEK